MAAPEYVDGVNASAVLTAMAQSPARISEGAQFCLEALRLGHQQNMSQFTNTAANAARTIAEGGGGRARQTSNEPPANR